VKSKIALATFLCALMSALASCGGGSGSGTSSPPTFEVSLSQTSLQLPQAGSASVQVSLVELNNFSGTASVNITGLPAGVTATNAAGVAAFGGGPYYSLASPLGPGQSQLFTVTFTDPGNATITFIPKVYSGPVQ